MKKYFIGFIFAGLSTAAFADFDLNRVNPDPKIQAVKEQCYTNTPKDRRGVVYRTPFRQCVIDSGVLKGKHSAKANRSQHQRMSFQDMQQLEQRQKQNGSANPNNNPSANEPVNPNNLNYPQISY